MGTRLTPMNILRDNLLLEMNRKIERYKDSMVLLAVVGPIRHTLRIIEKPYLGKSLIKQEEELFIDAFMDGFRLQSHHGDLIDEDKAKEIAKEVFERHYNKQEDES